MRTFLIIVFSLLLSSSLHARMRVHANVPFDRFPDHMKKHTKNQPFDKGFLDVTKAPYSADNTGKKDVTVILQRAIDDAFWNNLVVFFPEGTYLISDTLRPTQHGEPVPGSGANQRKFGAKLVGSHLGKRPVIRLADGAAANMDDPVMIEYEWVGKQKQGASRHYLSTLRNIDIDTGDNPSVTAVTMDGAQLCVIEDVHIYGKAFAQGIWKIPGSGGSISGLKITGGHTGIHASQYRPCPQLTGIELLGQSHYGLRITGARGTVTMTGFRIVSPSRPTAAYRPVYVENLQNWGKKGTDQGRANLCLVDGSIESTATKPLIESKRRSILLRNVFLKGATTLKLKGRLPVTEKGRSRWKHYKLFVWSSAAEPDAMWFNGKQLNSNKSGARYGKSTNGTPPRDLITRHLWNKAFPHWQDKGVLDIRNFGATPDNKDDDDALAINKAIQKGVATGKTVFIPRGHFHVHQSVMMLPGLRMIGAGNSISVIEASADWEPKIEGAIVDSPNGDKGVQLGFFAILGQDNAKQRGVESHKRLALFRLRLPDSILRNLLWVRWNTWRKKDVHVMQVPSIIFEDNAGGKVYNLCEDDGARHASGGDLVDPSFRTLLVQNTTNPLWFYEPSIEHMHASPPQVEFSNCSNVRIYSFKYEYEDHLLHIQNAENIEIIGGSGNYSIVRPEVESIITVAGGRNILIGNLTRKKRLSHKKKQLSEIEGKAWLIDETTGSRVDDEQPLLLWYKGKKPEK